MLRIIHRVLATTIGGQTRFPTGCFAKNPGRIRLNALGYFQIPGATAR